MQKAIIVRDSLSGKSIVMLNEHLTEGWIVIQTCPMPSSVTTGGRTYGEINNDGACLVIIEKKD